MVRVKGSCSSKRDRPRQRPRARAHERAKAPPPPSRHRGSTSGAALMVELPSSVTSEGVDCPTHSGWPTLRSTSRNWHAWNGSRSPMMTVPAQTAGTLNTVSGGQPGRSAWEVSRTRPCAVGEVFGGGGVGGEEEAYWSGRRAGHQPTAAPARASARRPRGPTRSKGRLR